MKATILVADTSVFIKWFRQQEVGADVALAIREAYLAGHVQLAAPHLALIEFANVMRYMQDLSTEQVQQAVQSLVAMHLTWLPPTTDVLQRAVAIAHYHETPVCDAVFAAVAEVLHAIYVTADIRFTNKVPDLRYVRPLSEFRLQELL